MASAAKKTYITPEEYLARELSAETKSEYHDGRIYAMAGTSFRHNVILGNLFSEIHLALKGRPCRTFTSDVRLQIESTGLYTYPDLMVICGELQRSATQADTLLNPLVIIEILSPSTEKWDRGGKFTHYRRLESLRDYILVSQETVLVEHYARQGNEWLLKDLSHIEDVLQIGSINCGVLLREIYAEVEFDPGGGDRDA
jgi:Uma2 family endonuclease